MLLYIIPHLLFSPVDKRIDLHQFIVFIPLHQVVKKTGYTLILSEATDPGIHPLESPGKLGYLSDSTAHLAIFDTVIEKVDAIFCNHLFHLFCIGKISLHANPEMLVGSGNQIVGLREKPARIQGKHFHCRILPKHHLCKYLVLETQAG